MKALKILLIMAGLLFLLLCFAGIYMAEGTMRISHLRIDGEGQGRVHALAETYAATLQDVTVSAHDAVSLRAWYLGPGVRNKNVVILLHGQHSNRAGMLGYAEIFLKHHYDVLIPDSRDHGDSGGMITTYGIEESKDMRSWIDWLTRSKQPMCIFGLGESMGAAVLLQSLRNAPQFCAVIAESSFSDFPSIVRDRVAGPIGGGSWSTRILLWPFMKTGFLYVKNRYHEDLWNVSPMFAVANTRIPVFLIHPKLDRSILPSHSERIFQAAKSGERPGANIELWEPLDCGHTGTLGRWPHEFEEKTVNWFVEHNHKIDMTAAIVRKS